MNTIILIMYQKIILLLWNFIPNGKILKLAYNKAINFLVFDY